MQVQRKSDMFFREATEDGKVALDVYFKIHEVPTTNVNMTDNKFTAISATDVNIMEVSDAGIIVYDTRISRKAVENKFNYMKMVEITEEDFNIVIIEKLKKKEKK